MSLDLADLGAGCWNRSRCTIIPLVAGARKTLADQHHVDLTGAVDARDQRVFDVRGAAGPGDEVHVAAEASAQELPSSQREKLVQARQDLTSLHHGHVDGRKQGHQPTDALPR